MGKRLEQAFTEAETKWPIFTMIIISNQKNSNLYLYWKSLDFFWIKKNAMECSLSENMEPLHTVDRNVTRTFYYHGKNNLVWSFKCELSQKFPCSSVVKNLPAMQETRVWFLGWEDSLEKEMANHSSILAWRIPLTEEPTGL